jgi:amino acid permease
MASYPSVLTSLGEGGTTQAMGTPIAELNKNPEKALAATSVDGSQKDVEGGDGLQRGLNSWHLKFIAIGGTIGTGLVSSSSLSKVKSCSLTCSSSSAAEKHLRRQDL